MAKIENAKISKVEIGFDNGFALTCRLDLLFDGTGQGFGGSILGGNPFDKSAKCAKHEEQKNYAADFIGGVLAVADVEYVHQLPNKVIRVKRETERGPIVAIGHPIKDLWYCPQERFAFLDGGNNV